MTKRAGAALFLATVALFLIANRAAYQGYFQDDELNNIAWTRDLPITDYAKAVLTPRFFTNNFRPVGHFYFREMSLLNGLNFPRYLPILHLAHLVNVWLVWLIARRLGISPFPASLGTLFFAFHMAAFDVYWKPMYVFDLFCATFCLLAIFLYARRRYVLAFCAFWLAYKSKELAVMLPVVLACYEFWFVQDRSWKRLVPFFAVSVSFGLQAMLLNPNSDNAYTFRFTLAAFWTSLRFYASEIFLIPHAGLALIALPLLVRDRRLWFGAAVMSLFFVPLLFLPGRLFAAYCYLPLAGLALMAATVATRPNLAPVVALLCIAWIPWNIAQLRTNRRATLAADAEARAYISALDTFAQGSKATHVFLYDGLPTNFNWWGVEGALRFLYGYPGPELHSIADVHPPTDPNTSTDPNTPTDHNAPTDSSEQRLVARQSWSGPVSSNQPMLLKWNPATRKLSVIPCKLQ
jgi:hypothetical protein